MAEPTTPADREAWLDAAERDLAAMRAWADTLTARWERLQASFQSITSSDVQAKTAMSGSQTGTPQPKTSKTESESFMAENKPIRLRTLAVRMAAGIHCRRTARRQSTGGVRRTVGRT